MGNQLETDRKPEALQSYNRAHEILDRLARDNPQVTQYQMNLAISLNGIGVLQGQAGLEKDGLVSLGEAASIWERLIKEHPEDPNYANAAGSAHYNMAAIEWNQKRFEPARLSSQKAVIHQRRALELAPNKQSIRESLANSLSNFAGASEELGKFDEAAKLRRELNELSAEDPAEAVVDARLADVISGKATPKDDAERITLSGRAYLKSLYVSSYQLSLEALANDPKLAEDRYNSCRYNAACSALLAASGEGKDLPQADDVAKSNYRKQALEWLQAELEAWAKVNETSSEELKARARKSLENWKVDADLAGIRDEKELAKLPEAEHESFKKLWDEHGKLIARAVAN